MKRDYSFTMPWWEKETILPFKAGSSFIVSGATKSGKTQWVKRLLENSNGMFVESPPENILYCYGVDQPAFEEMRKSVSNIIFHEGLPGEELLEKHKSRHTVVVLDDLMNDVLKNEDMEKMFTQGCHHRGLSVIFITQNLFAQGKCSRTISLNCTYMVLFRNLRDESQVQYLARQIGNKEKFMEAYHQAHLDNYGYLIVDMAPSTPKCLRLRTYIFPGEFPFLFSHE